MLVTNPVGLHARPAVKLTKLAKQLRCRDPLRAEGQADWVNAKSPNAVMKLKLRGGDTVCLEAVGHRRQRRGRRDRRLRRAQLR